jgi:hypothetical protein
VRARLVRPLLCVVRPITEVDGDDFGDKPVLVSQTRGSSIESVPIQVTYTSRVIGGDGRPGRTSDVRAMGLVLKRDADRLSWTPKRYDLVEIPGGDKLFVLSVEPAYPALRSVRRSSGGFDGWRLMLSSLEPTQSAATQYDQ